MKNNFSAGFKELHRPSANKIFSLDSPQCLYKHRENIFRKIMFFVSDCCFHVVLLFCNIARAPPPIALGRAGVMCKSFPPLWLPSNSVARKNSFSGTDWLQCALKRDEECLSWSYFDKEHLLRTWLSFTWYLACRENISA